MHARHIVLAVLAAAVTLTSVASAGPAAAKQRVPINLKIVPERTFVLRPQTPGALKRDSGRIAAASVERNVGLSGRVVMRDGQRVTIYYPNIWRLNGTRGMLTIRERNEWVDVGSDVNGDRFPDSVAIGTWKVVSGTGQYARLAGGGRSAHAGLGQVWTARYEGFLTRR
ncbi:MAG TPA: hypothetical protein VFT86_04120 [Gaiellaceae bacterium]|nr:hypothetical protein [Gaiellaceae bacterium]